MNETYTLEVLAEITGIETTTLIQYQEHGIIRPAFDDETVRRLRRAEHLRESCEMNLDGLKLLTHLMEEVEQLREELRRHQRPQ
ncbi:MAG: MerR family transcriptional regulator [Verrucomicrobiaceae bacterium]|nr:MerR family transcriptional regulator [Verrucomicrobiaceae bacterium]